MEKERERDKTYNRKPRDEQKRQYMRAYLQRPYVKEHRRIYIRKYMRKYRELLQQGHNTSKNKPASAHIKYKTKRNKFEGEYCEY